MRFFSKFSTHGINKKKLFILFFLIICTIQIKANNFISTSQISIKEAKIDIDSNFIPDKLGEYVTVAGRVTVPSGILNQKNLQIFIQDSTAGIAIFSSKYFGKSIKLGDSVIVTGKLNQYAGLTEIDNPAIKIIENTNTFIPKPLKINNYHNLEVYEGMYVNLDARIVDKGNNRGGKYLIVVPRFGSDVTLMVFISNNQTNRKRFENLDIGETINLNGIVGQYDYSTKPDSYYQIIPRFPDDISIIQHNASYYLIIILIFVALVLIISIIAVYFKFEINKRTKHLAESEKRFSNLADINSSAIFIYTCENFVYVNKTSSSLTGYTREELLNLKFWEIAHPDFREFIKQRGLDRQKGEQVPNRYEFKILNKNGKEIWLDFTAGIIEWKGENAVIGTAFDVTERKLVEEELRKFSRAVEQSPASVIITNTQGLIEFVNDKFCTITGYSKEEILGKNPRILKSGANSKEYYIKLWETILAGKDWKDEILNKKKSGELYWESEIISSIINKEGKITHFIAVKEDISEKKKMIEDLVTAKELAEQSNKLKDTFMANISHEIRTPLNGILGMTSLIKESVSKYINEDEEEYFTSIDRSSQRIIRTVDMILIYSSLQTGSFPLNTHTIELSLICKNLINEHSASAKRKSLLISFLNTCENSVYIIADDYSLIQAISNLVDNAIKYTNEGYVKIVLYSGSNNEIMLDIEDSGIGISQDNLHFIFEPYTQEDMGYGRAYDGVGLGLALVKEFLDLNKAGISIKSIKGKGTTFTLTLPLKR